MDVRCWGISRAPLTSGTWWVLLFSWAGYLAREGPYDFSGWSFGPLHLSFRISYWLKIAEKIAGDLLGYTHHLIATRMGGDDGLSPL